MSAATLQISTLRFKPYPALSRALPPRSQLSGRAIIITGGARGIGLSIAHAFAGAGARSVHLLGRTAATLQAAVDSTFDSSSCRIHAHVADIADEAAVEEAFGRIAREEEGPENNNTTGGPVLVHAAAFLPAPADFLDRGDGDGEWWRAFETNVHGTALVFRAFKDLVRRDAANDDDNNNEAVVINLVSASAYAFTAPGTSAYAASKLAALRLAECAAAEGAATATTTRIVNLHPGAVRTDMWAKSGGESVGIPCNDDELVPQFALWLTTPAARFLHGRTVEANWDIDELVAQKELIVRENLLTTTLRGYPFGSAQIWADVVGKSLRQEEEDEAAMHMAAK